MVNIIVGASSQSGKKEFQPGYIGLSRSGITLQDGSVVEPGFMFRDQETIEESISRILGNVAVGGKTIHLTLHAMAVGINVDYPQLLVKALKNQLSNAEHGYHEDTIQVVVKNKKQVNAILISFYGEADVKNPHGSHVWYPIRNFKQSLEKSLLTSDADKKKIVDLEVFDSPSSKLLGLTFILVVGQFLEFLEANTNHLIAQKIQEKIKNFLGGDYYELLSFFKKYPISGELQEGQLSMKELGDKRQLNPVFNALASRINFAKLSYISGMISELYLEGAMTYLKEMKDEILSTHEERVLLGWETIQNIYNNHQYHSRFEGIINGLTSKMHIKKTNENDKTSGVFMIHKKSKDGNQIEGSFHPTEENFDIIGSNEVGGHFGSIPLFMMDGLVYDLGLLDKNKCEHIKETKPMSMMFTGNEVVIMREQDTIILYNKHNKNEIFAKMEIGIQTKSTGNIEGGVILSKVYNPYSESGIPHGKQWFEIFSQNTLHTNPFGLNIDVRARIIEAIGVRLARNYFANPFQGNLDNLRKAFPKLKDFSNLRGIFAKVKTIAIDRDFEKKIGGQEFDVMVESAKGNDRLVAINTYVIVSGEIIAEISFTFN